MRQTSRLMCASILAATLACMTVPAVAAAPLPGPVMLQPSSVSPAPLPTVRATPAPAGVRIVSPKPKAVLYGEVAVLALPTGSGEMLYAVLNVDSVKRSVTNATPVRFNLDTTKYPNGTHVLQVEIYDAAGMLAASKPLQVIITNLPAKTTEQPLPEPVTPTTVATDPVAQPIESAKAPIIAKMASSYPEPVPAETRQAVPGVEATVLLDGKPLLFSLPPYIQQGRTMVLLRQLIAAAGGTLQWEREQGVAMVGERRLTFTLNQDVVLVEGGDPIKLVRPLTKLHGRVIIPVLAWQEIIGGTVKYQPEYHCVQLQGRKREILTPVIQAASGK